MQSFFKLNRLIVLFISIGFLVLSFEVYIMHFDQLASKKIMWTPIVFGVVAGISCLLIIFVFNRFSYYLFLFFMISSCFVGLLGLYLHNKWRFPELVNIFFHGKQFNFEILTTYNPVLAPSAFLGIGGLGILIIIFEGWGNNSKI